MINLSFVYFQVFMLGSIKEKKKRCMFASKFQSQQLFSPADFLTAETVSSRERKNVWYRSNFSLTIPPVNRAPQH